MNRDLEKILKEKWYLVAADFIAVLAILCLDLNPRDGLEATLAVLGILGASLIVVIPVLMDGGDKRERLAEQPEHAGAIRTGRPQHILRPSCDGPEFDRRVTERQRRTGLHIYMTGLQAEQLRTQQPRDGAGVVQRRALRGRAVRGQRIGEREQLGDGERRG